MLEFTFWDVQHGSACYVKTPNGRHIAIDLGTGSYSTNQEFSPLLYLKNKYKVNQLDYVVITHPHRDHIDDIANFDLLSPLVLHCPKHLTRDQIIAGNRKVDTEKVDAYLKISDRYNVTIEASSSAHYANPKNWGGARITFHSTPGCNATNLNNQSIVTVIEYAGSKIVIPGDNEPESWKALIEDQSFIAAAKGVDILLAPHHGRKSGYCTELFDAIGKPRLTVISDGRFCDTSATGSYGNQSSGWLVHYPDGSSEERLCVTTRNDGVIRVRAYIGNDNKPYLIVNAQKGSAKR